MVFVHQTLRASDENGAARGDGGRKIKKKERERGDVGNDEEWGEEWGRETNRRGTM